MLAQRNGLTKATVSAICDELISLNLICDAGQDRASPGRPGNLLALNALGRGSIGLEISTNCVAALLTDLCGHPLWQQAIAVTAGSSKESVLETAEALLGDAAEQGRQRELPLLGIGVAVPGMVDHALGMVVSAPALGWKEVLLKPGWEARFGLPVMVENKARAAAMAEALHGAARGVKDFLYVSIGTDVGSTVDAAVVIGGVPYRGAHGLAMNAGHMILDPDGEVCPCGQRGCWQAQADVSRETALVSARLVSGEPSVLKQRTPERLQNHRIIHQAALERDGLALDVFRRVVTLTHAAGIVNLIALFDPELVLIGFANVGLPSEYQQRMDALGGAADASIAEAVRSQMHARGLTPPAIRRAALDPDTIMLGAATLLVDTFLRTPPSPQP